LLLDGQLSKAPDGRMDVVTGNWLPDYGERFYLFFFWDRPWPGRLFGTRHEQKAFLIPLHFNENPTCHDNLVLLVNCQLYA
jgi:hypothetical protein